MNRAKRLSSTKKAFFVFGQAELYSTSSRKLTEAETKTLLSLHYLCLSPPPVSFVLTFPPSTLPDSHPLFVHISHWQAHSSPSAVISSLFFPLCVCLCVFNGSTCLLMPGESLTWRFLLMNQTPLIEHGCLCNDITHAFTHTMAIP